MALNGRFSAAESASKTRTTARTISETDAEYVVTKVLTDVRSLVETYGLLTALFTPTEVEKLRRDLTWAACHRLLDVCQAALVGSTTARAFLVCTYDFRFGDDAAAAEDQQVSAPAPVAPPGLPELRLRVRLANRLTEAGPEEVRTVLQMLELASWRSDDRPLHLPRTAPQPGPVYRAGPIAALRKDQYAPEVRR